MNNIKCIKFNDGPHKGQYGWFHNSTADAKVKEGIAEYYDPFQEKKPTMSNSKKEIEDYLDKNGIEYGEYANKSELLDLIDGKG